MSVDTAAKRLSMMDFGDGVVGSGIPAPTGGFDTAAERLHLLFLYNGLASAAAGADDLSWYYLRRRTSRWWMQ